MVNHKTQTEKAQQLRALHTSGKILVLPNIWDPLGALLLEDMGFPAVATASASVAFANGYDDGENIPLDALLDLLQKIVACVNVPVTADIECGYAGSAAQLQENITRFLDTGIVGINIEDTDKATGQLYAIETQCRRIELIRKVSTEKGVPLFINARTDVYLRADRSATPELLFEETAKRGMAYKAVGADGFYPIVMNDATDLQNMLERVQLPINVITMPGLPAIDALEKIGIARVSLGPSFLKIAIKAMKELALKLQTHQGLEEIVENDVTSAYLKQLVAGKVGKFV